MMISVSGGRSVRRGGFTFLEVLVVIVIISVLATIIGVKVAHRPAEARIVAARAQIGILRTALQSYRMDHGAYPSQAQGLSALVRRPEVPPVPRNYPEGGYLEAPNLPLDPWRNEYVYLMPGRTGESVEILSYGSDAKPGGSGDAADISSSDR